MIALEEIREAIFERPDLALTAAERAVLYALGHYYSDEGICHESNDIIGRAAGLHPTSASRIIARLERRGMLIVDRQGHNRWISLTPVVEWV